MAHRTVVHAGVGSVIHPDMVAVAHGGALRVLAVVHSGVLVVMPVRLVGIARMRVVLAVAHGVMVTTLHASMAVVICGGVALGVAVAMPFVIVGRGVRFASRLHMAAMATTAAMIGMIGMGAVCALIALARRTVPGMIAAAMVSVRRVIHVRKRVVRRVGPSEVGGGATVHRRMRVVGAGCPLPTVHAGVGAVAHGGVIAVIHPRVPRVLVAGVAPVVAVVVMAGAPAMITV
jgi:hypothetical protein